MDTLFFVCFASIIVAAYLLPSIIASGRQHKNVTSLTIVNIFFGWTFLGWVIALAWAFSDNIKDINGNNDKKDTVGNKIDQSNKLKELKGLADLKDKGILTEDEFEKEKKKILEKE